MGSFTWNSFLFSGRVFTFLFPSLIHFSLSISNQFYISKSAGFLQLSKMAGDQSVTLMLMQVLIQYISDKENEFMAWFQVFFLDNVIELGSSWVVSRNKPYLE